MSLTYKIIASAWPTFVAFGLLVYLKIFAGLEANDGRVSIAFNKSGEDQNNFETETVIYYMSVYWFATIFLLAISAATIVSIYLSANLFFDESSE